MFRTMTLMVLGVLAAVVSAQHIEYDWEDNLPPQNVFSMSLTAMLTASREVDAFRSIRKEDQSTGVAEPLRTLPGSRGADCRIEHEFGFEWRYKCVLHAQPEQQDRIFRNLVRLIQDSRQDWVVNPLRNAVFFRFRDLLNSTAQDRTWRVQVFNSPVTLIIAPPHVSVQSEFERISKSQSVTALPNAEVTADVVPSDKSLITVTNTSDFRERLLMMPMAQEHVISPHATQQIVVSPGEYLIAIESSAVNIPPSYGTATYLAETHYTYRLH